MAADAVQGKELASATKTGKRNREKEKKSGERGLKNKNAEAGSARSGELEEATAVAVNERHNAM